MVFGMGLFILSLDFNIELLGFFIASCGSFFHAMFNIYQKKTANEVDGLCVLMIRAGVLTLIAFLFCLAFQTNLLPHINYALFFMLLAGVMGTFVHYTRTKALKTERLSIVSLIIGTSPIFTYSLGVFVLNEPSDSLKTTAAIIMISSVLILGAMRVWKKSA